MQIENAVAFVTGGSTGLGSALTAELVRQGASKIYVASRQPIASNAEHVIPIVLDVTSPDDVAEAAAKCPDVSLVINNAGLMATYDNILDASIDSIRAEMETNLFGALLVTREFAPILARNGGGAFINVHSLFGWLSAGNGYSISKTALWGLSNATRGVVAPSNTQVLALHVGAMKTQMTDGFDVPKADPSDVARVTLSALQADMSECLFGDDVVMGKQALKNDPTALYAQY